MICLLIGFNIDFYWLLVIEYDFYGLVVVALIYFFAFIIEDMNLTLYPNLSYEFDLYNWLFYRWIHYIIVMMSELFNNFDEDHRGYLVRHYDLEVLISIMIDYNWWWFGAIEVLYMIKLKK